MKNNIKFITIKKYFNLGTAIENRMAKTNIVEAWPEGNEWKLELVVKKSNLKLPSKLV